MTARFQAFRSEERETLMPANNARVPARHMRRLAMVMTVTAVSALLQGCGTRDGMTTGSIPDDYRTRHPITLTEVEHTLDVPIASGDRHLTTGMRDSIKGFINEYKTSSSGVIQIQAPDGSMNAGAAAAARHEIRRMLTQSGVPSTKIIDSSYRAAPVGDAAPIRLSYVATKAVTNPCGQWPADVANNTFENKNHYNFGCATQNNLAAQIANPMDLITPRAMTPIDATQRGQVISDYRGISSGDEVTININNNN